VLVDTLGLILVPPAKIADSVDARQLKECFFRALSRRRLEHGWDEGGYTGSLVAWAQGLWRSTLETVMRTRHYAFRKLPRRWVVEQTFGWLGRYRWFNPDYKRQTYTGEVMVYPAMIRLVVPRVAML
jgi:putative transposase